MEPSQPPCAVPSCAAVAVAGGETCPVHRFARRVTKDTRGRRCRVCRRGVTESQWIKPEGFSNNEVEHVSCTPAKVPAAATKGGR